AKGEFRLRALSLERFGLGEHLAALERLKQKLAAEGLFAPERKRPLPLLPRRIGLVTGNDAAAKRDVITAITTRFPPARVLVAARLVVPDLAELVQRLDRARSSLERGTRRALERERQRLDRAHERLGRAPRLLLERRRARLNEAAAKLTALSPRATLERGYAI